MSHDPSRISVLISKEQVEERLKQLGEQISREYEGRELNLVCVLKGGSYFMIELSKYITVPVKMDFMQVSSYGSATKSSGNIKIIKDVDEPMTGRDVLIVEDIIDTGRTLSCLEQLFKDRKPASLKIATLLDKPDRREVEVPVDYVGFTIPDAFVVGCGLDYAQNYRNLPYVGVVEFDN